MTPLRSHTQSAAVWLLSRLGPENLAESLTGDLVEELGRGRSAFWLWKQVLGAIAIGVWHEARTHKLISLSGAATGLISLWLLSAFATTVLTAAGFPHAVNWEWQHGLVLIAAGFVSAALSGWVVGHLYRSHRQAAVFSFLASLWLVLAIELPLLYWLAPSVFFGTVVPFLPLALIVTTLGAPMAIVTGGFLDAPRRVRRSL